MQSAEQQTVKAQVMGKLTVFYRPPDHVNDTKHHAQSYLNELVEALIDMHPSVDEWDFLWRDFRKQWDRRYWPTFGEFPRRLGELRAKTAANRKAAGLTDPARSDHRKREIEAKPYRDGEFLAAYSDAMERSMSDDLGEAGLNAALVRMGNAMIERYDDYDRPRDPNRDNRVFVPGMENVPQERRRVDLYGHD